MKKKMLAFLLVLALCITGIVYPEQKAKAQDSNGVAPGAEIGYPFLTTEDTLIGYLQNQTRGIYLASGDSSITKIDSTTAGAGGSTSATTTCYVSVGVIVERLKNGSWGYWTSWSVSEDYDIGVMTGRAVTVTPGYYYRVRCTHRAGTDGSSSWTGGLYF